MLKSIAAGLCVSVVTAAGAHAAPCPAYPNALINGTTADANQVMANFTSILTCANTALAPLANPTFSGSVGIATATPADTLDVFGAQVIGAYAERLSLNTGSIGFNRHVSTGQIYNSSAYAYQFQHTPSTAAASDYFQLQVYNPAGGTVTGAAIAFNGTGNTAIGTGPVGGYSFYVNGQAGGTTGWVNAADGRLLTNVSDLTGALAVVEKLRPVRFQWRPAKVGEVGGQLSLPANQTEIGFLAQDVQAVVPEAVVPPQPGPNGTYGLKEESLIPLLVAAIKEQQAQIDQLRAQLAAAGAKGN